MESLKVDAQYQPFAEQSIIWKVNGIVSLDTTSTFIQSICVLLEIETLLIILKPARTLASDLCPFFPELLLPTNLLSSDWSGDSLLVFGSAVSNKAGVACFSVQHLSSQGDERIWSWTVVYLSYLPEDFSLGYFDDWGRKGDFYCVHCFVPRYTERFDLPRLYTRMSQEVKKGPFEALIIESSPKVFWTYIQKPMWLYLLTTKYSLMGEVWGKTLSRCEMPWTALAEMVT